MEADAEAEARLLLQEARESIEAARSYRRELEQRLRGLHQARKQIRESATLTRDVLEQHFNDLKGTLKKLLDERLMSLLQEVDAIEQESIKPLDECQKLIEHGVSTADDLLREGESAVHGDVGQQNEKLCSFTKKALHIQLDSLPEVPSLVDVPCLSAQLDDCLLTILKNQIFRHGTVASRPPVQLEEFVEKPGGILVRWCKVDDDFIPQDYRLQYRKSTTSHFEDVYVGSETEFIVLHIDPNVDYQFRVCARGDGRQEWSPWSVPQIGRTTLVPHEWTAGLEGYSLSSRRNIALRNDSQSCGVLYSKAPTYFCGQTLTFRIETVGQPDRRDSLGVCVEQQNGYDSLQRDKAVCISTNGAVFVNGKEMTNQLPAVTSGSTVTFDMEVVQLGPSSNEGGNFKLRVTISSNNREVVFDWLLTVAFNGATLIHSFWPPLLSKKQPVPFPWSLLKEKNLVKPLNKVADKIAFSHKYTIHAKNLPHCKMLNASRKKCIFSLKSSNVRTADTGGTEGRLTYSIFSVVKPRSIRFITRIWSNRNTFIQALVDDGIKLFCELRNT